ncbi:MAG: hypothetical protein P9L98_04275 [Candidatus Kaelpia imicola]|nr:hypothetical protein [Candidatus Kaelpia imicola]
MKANRFYEKMDKNGYKYLVIIANVIVVLFLFNSVISFAEESEESNDREGRLPVSSGNDDQKMQPILEGDSGEQSEDSEQEDEGEEGFVTTIKSNIRYDSKGREISWDEERYDSTTPDKIVYAHIEVEYDEKIFDRVVRYYEEGHAVGLPDEGASEGLDNHYTLERIYNSFNDNNQVTGYTEIYDGEDEHRESCITNIIYDENGNKSSYHEEGSNKDGTYSFDRTNIRYNKLNQIIEYNESGIDTEDNQYTSHTYGITYNSYGQRTGYISDSTSSGSDTDTSEDGSQTTVTTSTSSSHSVVTNMKYNTLGQMISYEGSSTFNSTGHSTTTYAGYPGRKTVSDYSSSGSSQTDWKATYDGYGVQTECGTKSNQSHTTGTSVTTDEANPDLVITTEFERDSVDGQTVYSYETIHNSAAPDLTTIVEKTNISYNQPSVWDWEEDEWDSGLSTTYTEVTHRYGSYTDEEGVVHQIDTTTTTNRSSTTYNELEQVTGYTEEITTIDHLASDQSKTVMLEMSDMVYDDNGRVLSYTQTTTTEGVTTTITRLNTQYNSWGQVIEYDEDRVSSVAPGIVTHIHKEEIKYNSFGQLIQSLEIYRDSSSDAITIALTLGIIYDGLGEAINTSIVSNLRGDLSYQEALEYGRNVYKALNDEGLRAAVESYYGSFNIYDDMTVLIDGARYVADIMAENDGMSFEDALEIAIEQIDEWHNET